MSAKKIGVAGLMALASLALIAVIASNPFSTQASTLVDTVGQDTQERLSADVDTSSQISRPEQQVQPQAADEDSEDSEPYIGVAIIEMDDGSVKVVRVLEGGPSDSVLKTGDLITAVDGTTIDGNSDLVDAITEAGSGETITLTITRDGSSQTVDVTVGERDMAVPSVRMYTSKKMFAPFKFPGLTKGRHRTLANADGRVVHSKIVFENEDGSFSTYRAVVGTVSDVDSTAGTFTLNPKDGSDSIDYAINDDTKVSMSRSGDLGPLNTSDETFVVDVDGEVKILQQGEWSGPRNRFFRGSRRFGLNDKDMWDGRHLTPRIMFEAFERVKSQADDKM